MSYKRISELVALSQQGDKGALEELLDSYENMIKGYANRYFFQGYQEEDLEQIARLKIVEVIGKYDVTTGANFTGFIDRVIRNTFNTMMRNSDNTEVTASMESVNEEGIEYWEMFADDFHMEGHYIEKLENKKLQKILNDLSVEEKELIVKVFSSYGGLKEYAKEKDITYKQARYAKDKIIDKIRNKLK